MKSHRQPLSRVLENRLEYADKAYAENTAKAYSSDWRDFVSFCNEHGFTSLPAMPATLAAYITDRSSKHKVATLERRLAAIAVKHTRHGHHVDTKDPVFRDVWRGVRRTKGCAQTRKAPITKGLLINVVKLLPDSLLGHRDRALLLLGFAGALRRSEIANLKVSDIRFVEEGMVATLSKSKTDQERLGREIPIPFARNKDTCTVRAVKDWIAAASRKPEDFLFCSVGRKNVPGDSISPKMIGLVVKKHVITYARSAGASQGKLWSWLPNSGAIVSGPDSLHRQQKPGSRNVILLIRQVTRV